MRNKKIAETQVGDLTVSTIYLEEGGNHPYETLRYGDLETYRWTSLIEALNGHNTIVQLLQVQLQYQ